MKKLKNWKWEERKLQLSRVIIGILVLTLIWVSEPLVHKSESKETFQKNSVETIPTIEVVHNNEQSNIQKAIPETIIGENTNEGEANSSIEGQNQEELAETMAGGNTIEEEQLKVKGIYVSGPMAGTKKEMNKLISLVNSTELNAMVIDIKNDAGEITYKMDYSFAKKIGATKNYIPDMKALVEKLKKDNIYLIGRIVTFKDPILADARNDLSIHNKDGSVFRDKKNLAWVNPYLKKVWNYNLNIALKAAEMGFDEIQFDYIRFSTDSRMKQVVFGDEAKNKTRQDAITDFTEYAYEVLSRHNVKVSADVYGTIISSEEDSKIVGQDYEKMARNLDFICPMIYPSQYAAGSYGIKNPDASPYEIVYKALTESGKLLENNKENHASVRPWLQDFSATWIDGHISYDRKQVEKQIKAVYESGCDEWILWNAKNSYSLG